MMSLLPSVIRLNHRLCLVFGIVLLLSFLPGLSAVAQTITGRVVAADDNQPLPGVSIIIKGTTTGTNTRSDGTYTINVPNATTTLTFSFIGYETQEVTTGNRSTINVSLAAGTSTLNEVVITALGIKKMFAIPA